MFDSGILDGQIKEHWRSADQLTMLLQLAGELAESDVKASLWQLAEPMLEPMHDEDSGEFTLGLGLNEIHPRGQLNARIMAGWVCERGSWSRIFNEPNLSKFDEPSVCGVDFPNVALSVARWDGTKMHLCVQPKNNRLEGKMTEFKIVDLDRTKKWCLVSSDGQSIGLAAVGEELSVRIQANNLPYWIEAV